MELMKKQHNPSVAIIVLRDGLQRSPPLIPPLPLLSSLAASLDTLSTSQDLQLIVTSLIRSRVTVSTPITLYLLIFTVSTSITPYLLILNILTLYPPP